MPSAKTQPTVVDLFCGAGGLSLGLHQAGFKIKLAVDHDEAAARTYARNLGPHIAAAAINEDFRIPTADVIVGGPPCQGFSSAGPRRVGDQRNSLVSVFAQIVSNYRPRAFIFENVEGFLTAESGRRVFDLLEPLIQAGYRIHLKKVNAANYGVPQHRKRVIAIGGLGWEPTIPTPTHQAFGAPGALRVATHLPWTPTLENALEDLPAAASNPDNSSAPDHWYRPLVAEDLERVRELKPGQTMRDLPEHLWHDSYRRRAFRRVMDGTPTERRGGAPAGIRRLRGDQPSKAITGGARSEFVHPTEDRYLTVRECARIQTFPDSFAFTGTTAERTQQIGNAVPPLLARAIGTVLMDDLASHSEPQYSTGALLTFTPTVSEGMSPALEDLTNAVTACFGSEIESRKQLALWH